MAVSDFLGQSAGPHEVTVTAEQIALFRKAVGARSFGDSAPPTFMTLYRKAEFELFEKMGIPLSKVLHAEQEYTYAGELRADDRLSFVTTVSQALEKKGASGSLLFLGFETRFSVDGNDIGSARTTVVIRDLA